MDSRVAVIVGAGPGLGAAVARALGRAGFAVALIARNEAKLTALGEALQAEDITAGWTAADVTDTDELTAAVTRFGGFSGQIDVLHHNAVAFRSAPASLLTSVAAALPFMRPAMTLDDP